MKLLNYLFLFLLLAVFSSCQDDISKADDILNAYKYDEAYELFKAAADEGNAYAKWRLSSFYNNGWVVDFDQQKAKSLLLEASKAGCEEAKVDEAFMYMFGWYDTKIDEAKGKNILDKLVKNTQNTRVLCKYALLLQDGTSPYEENQEKALKIINGIKDKENVWYFRTMGEFYKKGCDTIKVDINKSNEYFEKAFESGSAYSASLIANSFIEGEGIKKDLNKAIEWLKKGADVEESTCMTALSRIYLDESEEYKKFHNTKAGIDYLKKAVNHGNCEAMTHFGYCYIDGTGVGKDNEKAFEYFKKATLGGSSSGAFALGLAYTHGIGCNKNPKEGIKVWERAVELGDGSAANNLYCIYDNGEYGITKNKEKARKYLLKAAKLEDSLGCLNLGSHYYSGSDLFEKNRKQAFIYFKKSAHPTNPVE